MHSFLWFFMSEVKPTSPAQRGAKVIEVDVHESFHSEHSEQDVHDIEEREEPPQQRLPM
jgi:hypothetical protein